MAGNLLARSVHDLTAAAWFGGSLMGAIGVNGAAAEARTRPTHPTLQSRLDEVGSDSDRSLRHTPRRGPCDRLENRERIAKQDSVGADTIYKTAVTLAGAAVTLYAGVLGKKVEKLAGEGAEGATEPRAGASDELQAAQKQLKALQWAIPVFAAWVIVLGAKHGEMQRPKNVFKGLR